MQENAPGCGRENDLIAFLYSELSEIEKKSFESHMHSCRVCLTQAQEFRSIRESVVAWRDESLGQGSRPVPEFPALINRPKASAMAALRAFFDLSPLWMKGAVGFAAVVFGVFSVLAVVNLKKPTAIITAGVNNQSYSAPEVNALVEQRVQEELTRRHAREPQPPPALSRASVALKDKNVPVRSRGFLSSGNQVAANIRNGKARRPLSKAEREQLASDLRLVRSGSESSFSLIGDQINQ